MSDRIDPQDYYDFPEAFKEGWAISQARGNADGTAWRIESMDEVDLFPGRDPQAHSFVFWNATGGNENCVNALVFLLNNEPFELAEVFKHAGVEVSAGAEFLMQSWTKKMEDHIAGLERLSVEELRFEAGFLKNELRMAFEKTIFDFVQTYGQDQPRP